LKKAQDPMKAAAVCSVMKAHREHEKILQAEIAHELELPNKNFISMVESGRSKIPVARITEFVKAYRLNPAFSLVIIKWLRPGIWALFKSAVEDNPNLFKSQDPEPIDRVLDDSLVKLLKKHKLDSFVDALNI
jgi:hypothetical protein